MFTPFSENWLAFKFRNCVYEKFTKPQLLVGTTWTSMMLQAKLVRQERLLGSEAMFWLGPKFV
jgi:hypothetical protein